MKKDSLKDDFVEHLSRYIGETVTIFTTSGGVSGQGFTGVLLSVNHCFIRLITRIDPDPGRVLSSSRTGREYRYGGYYGDSSNTGALYTIGSVADIPIDRIASFVHNAV